MISTAKSKEVYRERNHNRSWERILEDIATANRQWIKRKNTYEPKPKYGGYPEIILKEKTLDL